MGALPEEATAILNFLPDPLFLIDRDQKVLWCNRQAKDTFGSTTESFLPLVKVTGIRKIEQLAGQVLESRLPLEFSYEDATVKIKRQERCV